MFCKIFHLHFTSLGDKNYRILMAALPDTMFLCVMRDDQSRWGPECSRKLRFPDFVTTAQVGGRLPALRTGRLYPQEILIYARG